MVAIAAIATATAKIVWPGPVFGMVLELVGGVAVSVLCDCAGVLAVGAGFVDELDGGVGCGVSADWLLLAGACWLFVLV